MLDTVLTLGMGGAEPTRRTVVFLTVEYILNYWDAGTVQCVAVGDMILTGDTEDVFALDTWHS